MLSWPSARAERGRRLPENFNFSLVTVRSLFHKTNRAFLSEILKTHIKSLILWSMISDLWCLNSELWSLISELWTSAHWPWSLNSDHWPWYLMSELLLIDHDLWYLNCDHDHGLLTRSAHSASTLGQHTRPAHSALTLSLHTRLAHWLKNPKIFKLLTPLPYK